MKIDIKYEHDLSGLDKDSRAVMDSWGLSEKKTHNLVESFNLDIIPNKIYYFYGYSGSGKSSILNYIYNNLELGLIYYVNDYREFLKTVDTNVMVIDYFKDEKYETRLKVLAKCGLTEAWKYVTKVKDLSDGEKFRFVLYYHTMKIMSERGTSFVLIFDEFCSTLDRVTAKAIAQNITRIRDSIMKQEKKITMIFASAHEDLIEYMNADYVYFKEFYPLVSERK